MGMGSSGSCFSFSLLLTLLVAVSLGSAAVGESAITCNQVIAAATPCLPFLQGAGAVSPSCCSSLRSLYASANTSPDRQAACACVKSFATSLRLNPATINQLPVKCAVNIPYKFTPNIDCTRIQ